MSRKRFAIILVLVAVASFAIVLDHLTRSTGHNVDFHETPGFSVTSTASPAPGR